MDQHFHQPGKFLAHAAHLSSDKVGAIEEIVHILLLQGLHSTYSTEYTPIRQYVQKDVVD